MSASKARMWAVLAFLAAVQPAFGQAQKGSITVRVVDQDGGTLPGAVVSAQSGQTLSRRSGVADDDGVVALRALEPAPDYVVTTALESFSASRSEGVLVRAGQNTPIQVVLSLAAVSEQIDVRSEYPTIDLTSAVTGQQITLELSENLPTGRTYLDYLQLVPGVQIGLVCDDDACDPASRSGRNSNLRGRPAPSSDNFYFVEGIPVTDIIGGVSGAGINTEIIQEQSVLTGGVPAEFTGASGLVSNVVTKSGGNHLSGSINYYFQNSRLVEENDRLDDNEFSAFDTAFTLGGPVVKDRAWFSGSFRLLEREEDVTDQEGDFRRTVTRSDDQGFAKLTWTPTRNSLLTGVYLSDPWDRDGTFDEETPNWRDTTAVRGGERYTASYSHVLKNLVLGVDVAEHSSAWDRLPNDPATRNDIDFKIVDLPRPAEELYHGGFGRIHEEDWSIDSRRTSLEWLTDTAWGKHTFKLGLELSENRDLWRDRFAGDGALYQSLDTRYLGQSITAGEVIDEFFDAWLPTTSNLRGLNELAPATLIDLLDTDRNGVVSAEEARAIVLDSTAGNPGGFINYIRLLLVGDEAVLFRSEGTSYFLQDTWQQGRWSVNAGVRAERREHFASSGAKIFTFDWQYAPRLSVVHDVRGRGRQRLSAYYGRYYDPIRDNATAFAGSVTGVEFWEQIFITTEPETGAGEWTTFRIRGGPRQPDAMFAPTTRMPYTDEFQLGYKIDLGRRQSVEVNLIRRETRDLQEDYDLGLYADPDQYGLPIEHPDSLFLGLDYFGFTEFPDANFIIATLAGGKRDWDGVEVVFRKRMGDNWQMLASYNYAEATGNTNSDSSAGWQGDVLWMDPRAIHREGAQPGLVAHLLKVAASYRWNNGLTIGSTVRWSSGAVGNRSDRFFLGLPVLDLFDPAYEGEPIQFAGGSGFGEAGGSGFWLSPYAIGTSKNPAFGILDLRVAYVWPLRGRWKADLFIDVFNVTNDQRAIVTEDSIRGGRSGTEFGDGVEWLQPRRYYLGVRLRF